MHTYLVGGAVRDQCLGLPVTERDWVVVGATPAHMLANKFQPVGKDFPVFLHPKTHEEYALARTERKSGRGYAGFSFNTDVSVTLEQDLLRRDLTINAMAQTEDGTIIDPYHGLVDLKARVLRHVSDAFIEDPVRLLRVARFAARFAEFNFTIAAETLTLMQQMVLNGEVDFLVAERVWAELQKALETTTPSEFFNVLQACHALPVVIPELASMPNNRAMDSARAEASWIRYAILVAHLPEKCLVGLHKRLRIPKKYSELAIITSRWLKVLPELKQASAGRLVDFLLRTDALRRPERLQDLLTAGTYIWTLSGVDLRPLSKLIEISLLAMREIDIEKLQAQGLQGAELGGALKQQRIAAVAAVIDRLK